MTGFQVERGEEPRSLWPSLLIGVVVVAVVVGIFAWMGKQPAGPAPTVAPMPFGAAEKAYTSQLKFEQMKVSRFANMLNQEVTYLDGIVVNKGNRSVANVQLNVEFFNVENQVVKSQTVHLLGDGAAPIAAGESREFRLGFELIPDDWDMQVPNVRVIGILFR
jgi:hypothetical protein